MGATDAFCSPFIVRTRYNSGPCHHHNRYGYKQALCTSRIRCVTCSKGHLRDEYTNNNSLKCPAYGDVHTVFDSACKLHPQHYRHVRRQKARTKQGQRSAAMDVDMNGSAQTSPTNASSASGGEYIERGEHTQHHLMLGGVQDATREHRQARDGALEFVLRRGFVRFRCSFGDGRICLRGSGYWRAIGMDTL